MLYIQRGTREEGSGGEPGGEEVKDEGNKYEERQHSYKIKVHTSFQINGTIKFKQSHAGYKLYSFAQHSVRKRNK